MRVEERDAGGDDEGLVCVPLSAMVEEVGRGSEGRGVKTDVGSADTEAERLKRNPGSSVCVLLSTVLGIMGAEVRGAVVGG